MPRARLWPVPASRTKRRLTVTHPARGARPSTRRLIVCAASRIAVLTRSRSVCRLPSPATGGPTGTRKGETGEHLLFAFLTTAPSDVVRPVHSKAMPVILTGNACDIWLEADAAAALRLQQPWPADRLAVVATGQRQDTTPAAAA